MLRQYEHAQRTTTIFQGVSVGAKWGGAQCSGPIRPGIHLMMAMSSIV